MSCPDKNINFGTTRDDVRAYQDTLVRKGLEEIRLGKVVSHDEVVRRMKLSGRTSQSSDCH